MVGSISEAEHGSGGVLDLYVAEVDTLGAGTRPCIDGNPWSRSTSASGSLPQADRTLRLAPWMRNRRTSARVSMSEASGMRVRPATRQPLAPSTSWLRLGRDL